MEQFNPLLPNPPEPNNSWTRPLGIAVERLVRMLRGFKRDGLNFYLDHPLDAPLWDRAGRWADVRAYGAAVDGVTDDTAAMAAAVAACAHVYVPAGTLRLTGVDLSGVHLHTQGQATVFHQLPGQPVGTRILRVTGSNTTIEDCTLRGNITTDTDEQQHGVFVRGASTVRNVTLGNIRGENVRGDVVYIGGLASAPVYDVSVDSVYGDNVYRNVLTITGGNNVSVGSYGGVNVGYMGCDVEPNSGSQACDNIRFGHGKGAVSAVIGGDGVGTNPPYVGSVSYEQLDLDPSYAGNSTPAYSSHNVSIGFTVRCTRHVRVGAARINGHAKQGVYLFTDAADTLYVERVVFGYLYMASGSLSDAVNNCYIFNQGCRHLSVLSGNITLGSAAKGFILGNSAAPQPVDVRNLECNGRIINYAAKSRFEAIKINNAAFDAYAFFNVTDSEVAESTITLGRLAGICTRLTFDRVTAVCATFLFDGSNTDHTVRDSTLNAVYFRDQLWSRTYVNARGMGNPVAGAAAYLWADATSRLRLKATAPTTDLDGSYFATFSGSTGATGDLPAFTSANTLGVIPAVAVGSYLRSAGTSTLPIYSTLTLPNAGTLGDLFAATGTNAMGVIPAAAAGKVLRAAGAGTLPAWSSFTIPDTFAAGDVLWASATNTLAAIAKPSSQSVFQHDGVIASWSTTVTAATYILNAAAGVARNFIWRSAGVARWVAAVNATAEGGANAGSNFELQARDDAGAVIGVALAITRSSMAAVFAGSLTAQAAFAVTGTATLGGSLAHSGTAVGFYGVTPVARPAALTQTYATASATHANLTSADLTGISSSTTGSALAEPSVTYVQLEHQQNYRRLQVQFNALKADVTNLKQFVNTVVDYLQANGLFQ